MDLLLVLVVVIIVEDCFGGFIYHLNVCYIVESGKHIDTGCSYVFKNVILIEKVRYHSAFYLKMHLERITCNSFMRHTYQGVEQFLINGNHG